MNLYTSVPKSQESVTSLFRDEAEKTPAPEEHLGHGAKYHLPSCGMDHGNWIAHIHQLTLNRHQSQNGDP